MIADLRAWLVAFPGMSPTPTTLRPLEALAVDDRRAFLVVLGLGDPHLLEGGERGQDRAADLHRDPGWQARPTPKRARPPSPTRT